MFYLNLLALLVLDLLGLSLAKLWQLHGQPAYLALCVLMYSVAAIFLALTLKFQGAAITNIIWVALSAIGMTIIGYYVFHEPITLWQFVGIGIIIFGLAVIQWK